jgi:hypothetical protein
VNRRLSKALLVGGVLLTGCYRSPPPSRFPSADAALERMHATYECSRGLQGEAKLEFVRGIGRMRANLLYIAVLPEQVRFDVYSQLGVVLSTLTSDGKQFALRDFRDKVHMRGPASACNLERFTQVPVPPHALTQLLRGEAPVLVHTPNAATIAWEKGRYVVRIASKHSARQEIHLEPTPADWSLPWARQRLRVREVSVEQHGIALWSAELAGHAATATARPRVDPDGLSAPVPPSGPPCEAEVPRVLRFEAEDGVTLRNQESRHNPPLVEGVFSQQPSRGFSVRYVSCGG